MAYNMGVCSDVASNMLAQKDRNQDVDVNTRDTEGIDAMHRKALDHEWDVEGIILPPNLVSFLIAHKDEDGAEIPYENQQDRIPVSCSQIWSFTKTVLFRSARSALDPENIQKIEGGETTLPLEDVLADINEFLEEGAIGNEDAHRVLACLLYTSPSPRDQRGSRMPSSA